MKKSTLCIIIIVLDLVFLVGTTIILKKFYNNVYRIAIFTYMALISNFLCVLYLANNYPKLRLRNNNINVKAQRLLFAISCLLTVSMYAMFFTFLPVYTVQDAYTVIKSDPVYMSSNINEREGVCITSKHGNPFAGYGYTFDCEINGEVKSRIYFNPISGEYGRIKE